jgi:hypothetical protein
MRMKMNLFLAILIIANLHLSAVVAKDLYQNGINPNESVVTLTAHVDPYIHGRVGHRVDVYGRHNISITNTTPIERSYQWKMRVCADYQWCNEKNGNVNLKPGATFSKSDSTMRTMRGDRPTRGVFLEAYTYVNSPGVRYWSDISTGKMDYDW